MPDQRKSPSSSDGARVSPPSARLDEIEKLIHQVRKYFQAHEEDLPFDVQRERFSECWTLFSLLDVCLADRALDGFLAKHPVCRELLAFLYSSRYPYIDKRDLRGEAWYSPRTVLVCVTDPVTGQVAEFNPLPDVSQVLHSECGIPLRLRELQCIENLMAMGDMTLSLYQAALRFIDAEGNYTLRLTMDACDSESEAEEPLTPDKSARLDIDNFDDKPRGKDVQRQLRFDSFVDHRPDVAASDTVSIANKHRHPVTPQQIASAFKRPREEEDEDEVGAAYERLMRAAELRLNALLDLRKTFDEPVDDVFVEDVIDCRSSSHHKIHDSDDDDDDDDDVSIIDLTYSPPTSPCQVKGVSQHAVSQQIDHGEDSLRDADTLPLSAGHTDQDMPDSFGDEDYSENPFYDKMFSLENDSLPSLDASEDQDMQDITESESQTDSLFHDEPDVVLLSIEDYEPPPPAAAAAEPESKDQVSEAALMIVPPPPLREESRSKSPTMMEVLREFARKGPHRVRTPVRVEFPKNLPPLPWLVPRKRD